MLSTKTMLLIPAVALLALALIILLINYTKNPPEKPNPISTQQNQNPKYQPETSRPIKFDEEQIQNAIEQKKTQSDGTWYKDAFVNKSNQSVTIEQPANNHLPQLTKEQAQRSIEMLKDTADSLDKPPSQSNAPQQPNRWPRPPK